MDFVANLPRHEATIKTIFLVLTLVAVSTGMCSAAQNPFEAARSYAEIAGNLHAALLFALILATMAVCWRYGKRPLLAAPIVIVAQVTCFLTVNLLLFLLIPNSYLLVSEHALSITTFIAHQVAILLGCLLALLYALPWKPRLVTLSLLLCVAFLIGWHFNRLVASDWYRASGTAMIERREKAGANPIALWHTWLTGLDWVSYTHPVRILSPQEIQIAHPPTDL